LKIVDGTNIVIDFLGNATVNKIMGASTVNKDDDFPMLNKAIILRVLGVEKPMNHVADNTGHGRMRW
jgi:hypothetical protein